MFTRNLGDKVIQFLEWLSLDDYYKAKDEAAKSIIMRYGRGNMSFQNGDILNRSALDSLSSRGDKALAEIITVKEAQRRPTTTVVETIKTKPKPKK